MPVSESASQKKEREVQALRDARDAAEATRMQTALDAEADSHVEELEVEAEALRKEIEFIKGATRGKVTSVDADVKAQLAANASADSEEKVK